MKTFSRIACLLFAAGAVPLAANPGSGILNLVTGQTGINKLTITVSAVASGLSATDTKTTTVTGTVNASFDANPSTGATTAMTITGGNIAMTDMHFVLKALIFITVADITTANMGGTAYTPAPIPAPVTPTATGGTFDAALHRVVINRGTMTGAITYTDPDTPVNADFATAPVEGAGTGTGIVTMVPDTFDATHRTVQATVQIPVDFTDTQDMSGTPVSVRVVGTIKAAGPVRIPLNILPAPTFNPVAGIYPAGQAITITGQTGSTIYYRLNGGTEQSAASPVTGLAVPAYPASLTISAYANKSGMADSPVAQVTYTSSSPYETWAETYFPGVTDPAIRGPEADPDGNGQANFFEFALGGNPNDAAINAIIHSRIGDAISDPAEKLLVTIAVRAGTPVFAGAPSPSATKDGVSYTVQGSGDLADFSAGVLVVAPVTTDLPAVPSGYQYRSFSLDRATTGSGFLRVRVSTVP